MSTSTEWKGLLFGIKDPTVGTHILKNTVFRREQSREQESNRVVKSQEWQKRMPHSGIYIFKFYLTDYF